jgi:hypothetical protein
MLETSNIRINNLPEFVGLDLNEDNDYIITQSEGTWNQLTNLNDTAVTRGSILANAEEGTITIHKSGIYEVMLQASISTI